MTADPTPTANATEHYAKDELLFSTGKFIRHAQTLLDQGALGGAHQALTQAAETLARAMAAKEHDDD